VLRDELVPEEDQREEADQKPLADGPFLAEVLQTERLRLEVVVLRLVVVLKYASYLVRDVGVHRPVREGHRRVVHVALLVLRPQVRQQVAVVVVLRLQEYPD